MSNLFFYLTRFQYQPIFLSVCLPYFTVTCVGPGHQECRGAQLGYHYCDGVIHTLQTDESYCREEAWCPFIEKRLPIYAWSGQEREKGQGPESALQQKSPDSRAAISRIRGSPSHLCLKCDRSEVKGQNERRPYSLL